MRKYLLFLPLLFLFGAGSASAVGLLAPLGLTTQYPDFNTQGLEVTFDSASGDILLNGGAATTAQLTAFEGDLGDLYTPSLFSYKLSGNVNDLANIDFSASTADNKVNLTGTVVDFGSATGILSFLVDVNSTGTVDFGTKLGIIVSNIGTSETDKTN